MVTFQKVCSIRNLLHIHIHIYVCVYIYTWVITLVELEEYSASNIAFLMNLTLKVNPSVA